MNLFFKIKCVAVVTGIILLSHGRIQYHSSIYSAWKKSKATLEDKVGNISCENKANECYFSKRWRSKSTKVLVAAINEPSAVVTRIFSEQVISNTGNSFLRSTSRSHHRRGPPTA